MSLFIKRLLSSIFAGGLSTVAFISWAQSFLETSYIVVTLHFLFFTVMYFTLFYIWKKEKGAFTSFLVRPTILIFVTLFSLLLLFSLYDTHTHLFDNFWLVTVYVYLISFLTVLISSLLIIYLFSKINLKIKIQHVSKWNIILYSLPAIFIWSIILLAVYPAQMSPDSFSHWNQIHTLDFNNWHPVIYTWFMLLVTKIWFSPAMVVISQIIIVSLVFGYGLYRFECSGLSKKIMWIFAGIIAIYPTYGIFISALWKDIFYSASILLLTIILFTIFSTNGKWLSSPLHIGLISVTGLAAMFMRSNGLPIYFLVILLLCLAYRKYITRLALSLGIVLVAYFIISGPVYEAFDVESGDPNEILAIPTQQIARVVTESGELNAEQSSYIYSILPKDKWIEYYDPYLNDPIKFSAEYDRSVIFDDFSNYLIIWSTIVKDNFGITVNAFLKQTSLVWQVNEPAEGYTNLYPGGIYSLNTFKLEQEPISNSLHDNLFAFLTRTEIYLKELIWRPATYMFTILIFGFVGVLKNGKRFLLLLLPVFLNIGTVFAGIPAQDFRYLLANSFVLFILFLAMLMSGKDSKGDIYE